MPRVTGEVVDVKSRDWAMDGRTGTTITLVVQESRASIVNVKLPQSWPGHLVPRADDAVDLLVDARVSGSAAGLVAVSHFEGYTTPGGIEFPPAVVDGRPVTSRSDLASAGL